MLSSSRASLTCFAFWRSCFCTVLIWCCPCHCSFDLHFDGSSFCFCHYRVLREFFFLIFIAAKRHLKCSTSSSCVYVNKLEDQWLSFASVRWQKTNTFLVSFANAQILMNKKEWIRFIACDCVVIHYRIAIDRPPTKSYTWTLSEFADSTSTHPFGCWLPRMQALGVQTELRLTRGSTQANSTNKRSISQVHYGNVIAKLIKLGERLRALRTTSVIVRTLKWITHHWIIVWKY